MYMIFSCEYCNYESYDFSNFSKHKKSKKHQKKEIEGSKHVVEKKVRISSGEKSTVKISKTSQDTDDKNTCGNCNLVLKSRQSLSHHQNICYAKIIEDKNTIIKEKDKMLQKITKEKNTIIEEKDKMIEYLKSLNTKQLDVSKINSTANQASISALTYLMTHRKSAPALQQIDYNGAIELLKYDDNKSNKYVESLIFEFRKKHISKMIALLIVAQYKTTNPNDQSIWSTDVSRLNYLIRDVAAKNSEPTWITDKKGVKLTDYVIKPILDAIHKITEEYMNAKIKENQMLEKGIPVDYDFIHRNIKLMLSASDLMGYIKYGTMVADILSELAPQFNLDKSLCIKTNVDYSSDESDD